MKTIVSIIVIVAFFTGCSEPMDKSQFNREFFPTNHWKVVGQGTNGQVVVETQSTNVAEYFRVHAATPMVSPMTNGQPVRVQLTLRANPRNGWIDLISSKAYPAEK